MPLHHHHARLIHAALRHAEQGAEAQLAHLLWAQHLHLQAELVSFLQRSAISAGFSTLGGSLTRSRVMNTPLATALQRFPCRLRTRRIAGEQRELGEFRLVLRLLLGAVPVESIGPQHRAERHLRGLRRLQRTAGDAGGRLARESGGGVATGLVQYLRGQFGGLAEADRDHPR